MERVHYSVDEGVATLTLRDPPANTYGFDMLRELDAAILRVRMDEAAHVVVLRGDGDRYFCGGADMKMFERTRPSFKNNFCLYAHETLQRLEQTPKLVIAAINGHCLGGGFEVALACDLRVVRKGRGPGAVEIGLPEVSLGVLRGAGGTQRLARLVGRSKAIELMALGEPLTVERTKALGLVNEVLPEESFEADVRAYAHRFVPPGKASRAVGALKRAVLGGLDGSLASGLALERELQQQLFASDDGFEGIGAFVEKRTPTFKGR